MTDMTVKKAPQVLAIEIRNLQQQAQVVVLSYAIEIGRRLCEAKAVLEHGKWGPWLAEQVEFSQSTAQNYMKIYERYGSEQISLFGDAKTETIGNLPYTKALKLLAVPDEEMDDFLAEHDVDAMSTRELEQAIRERDAARAELEQQKATSESYKESALKFKNFAEDRGNAVKEAEAAAAKARAEADKLRAELAQVKSERYTDQAIVGERNIQLQWAKELASQDARIAALADAAGKAAEQSKADIACLKENMMLQMQIAKLETEKESCKCASRLEAQINQVANTAAMGIQQNANGLACLQNIVNGLYKIVVPIDAVCPTPMPKFNSWTAPTTTAAAA